ncbi:trypsin-like peptidase domain-containing protein [Streptosporangium sp. LJ11]|uniref:S1 family peptidase n=1 Tax=Streptosporangium sp. LJ11 TaxID=3436927 RepID=UPI003F7AABF5
MSGLRDRVVEVLCDHGADAVQRWSVGSGFLVGGRLVLTSAHVVDGGGELTIRRLGAGESSGKHEWSARLLLLGDRDVADLALIEVGGEGDRKIAGDIPLAGFSTIDRHTDAAMVVEGCWSVGFPAFKTLYIDGAGPVRETAQIDGVIPTAEDLYSGLLTLRVSSAPRPLPPKEEALGQSAWSGMSGAAVVVGGRIVAVVSEHHPRAGQSALTLTPISHINRLPDAGRWWRALGVAPARLPVLPARPPVLVSEPPALADCFQLRRHVHELATALLNGEAVVLAPERSGLGGVGVTQLAAHYARTAWERSDVDVLVWMKANDRDAVVKTYAETAAALETSSLPAWLAATDRRWLIVFDDVGHPDTLRGLWPPRNPAGRVLITTRRQETASRVPYASLIEVGLFTEEEAAAFVTAQLGTDAVHAGQLARELGCQPLALAQAVAYMRAHGLDCRQYLERYGHRRGQLPLMLLGDGSAADRQRSSVTVAWSLSVEQGGHPVETRPQMRYDLTTSRDGSRTVSVICEPREALELLPEILQWGTSGHD